MSLVTLNYWSFLVVVRNCFFYLNGREELSDDGETREKLSLVFSLFPPSTGIVRGDPLHEGVYSDFGDS